MTILIDTKDEMNRSVDGLDSRVSELDRELRAVLTTEITELRENSLTDLKSSQQETRTSAYNAGKRASEAVTAVANLQRDVDRLHGGLEASPCDSTSCAVRDCQSEPPVACAGMTTTSGRARKPRSELTCGTRMGRRDTAVRAREHVPLPAEARRTTHPAVSAVPLRGVPMNYGWHLHHPHHQHRNRRH
ncbi:hypothetical protein [Streptomyces decoyicus]